MLDAGLVLDPPVGTRLASFEVISVTQLGTRRLLISLAGESPWGFDYCAGQDLVLVVANDGARTDYGRYLIKRSDPRTRHLHIEAVLEPDGPAAQWVASVVPGEPVTAIGPRECNAGSDGWHAERFRPILDHPFTAIPGNGIGRDGRYDPPELLKRDSNASGGRARLLPQGDVGQSELH